MGVRGAAAGGGATTGGLGNFRGWRAEGAALKYLAPAAPCSHSSIYASAGVTHFYASCPVPPLLPAPGLGPTLWRVVTWNTLYYGTMHNIQAEVGGKGVRR